MGVEAIGSLQRQFVERHTVGGLGPLLHLIEIYIATVLMDKVDDVVMVSESLLICIKSLHATSFKLSESDILVSGIPIKLFICNH